MFKFSSIVLAIAALGVSAAQANTVVPGNSAVLIDNASIVNSTVTPTTYLTYLSGGNGAQGWADGDGYYFTGDSTAAAMATADHIWAQYEYNSPIFFGTTAPLSSVLAIPAVDHDYATFEHFEFRVWGVGANGWEEGKITTVYTLGVDDSGPGKKADDWSTVWAFSGSYTVFAVTEGDHVLGGPKSPGEGEIDALAAAPVPEPSTYGMLLAGLAVMGGLIRRRT